jgi:uncharacterized protein (TIGR02246 family)
MGPQSPTEWWPHFQRALLDGDMEAVLALYERDAVFASPAGPLRHGHDELRPEFAPLVAAKADFTVEVRKIIASDDIALLHSAWRITRPQPMSGIALEVLRRQPDGRWLLAIGEPEGLGQGQG